METLESRFRLQLAKYQQGQLKKKPKHIRDAMLLETNRQHDLRMSNNPWFRVVLEEQSGG